MPFACRLVLEYLQLFQMCIPLILPPLQPTVICLPIFLLYTLPAYRRQGIAQHNMQRLVDYARVSGLDYVNLSATKAGYPVYQKVGFSERQSHYTEMQIR